MVKACRGVAEEFMKSRDRWKEAGTFVPARMKKRKIFNRKHMAFYGLYYNR